MPQILPDLEGLADQKNRFLYFSTSGLIPINDSKVRLYACEITNYLIVLHNKVIGFTQLLPKYVEKLLQTPQYFDVKAILKLIICRLKNPVKFDFYAIL